MEIAHFSQSFGQSSLLPSYLQEICLSSSRPSPEGTEGFSLHGASFVVHCFSYSLEIAKRLIALDCYFGFTGVITFKNAKKSVEVLKELPLDRILVETDCPYMAPEPNRGKRCDSSMLKFTVQKIAQVKEQQNSEMIEILNKNASEFYKINI